MAKCDQGYICDVCAEEVEEITESDLYLRFVIGMLDPETLHTSAERHLRCNPSLAQFVVDDRFPAVVQNGDFDKRQMDTAFVHQREELVTRGWQRLLEISQLDIPILEYPLPEVSEALRRQAEEG
ncbi:MAG TPA: hypothetical protein EYN70_15420 [Planctomycetaceae bacterium]|nr:hypothetical protein [Planctomycetaceae bacterium]